MATRKRIASSSTPRRGGDYARGVTPAKWRSICGGKAHLYQATRRKGSWLGSRQSSARQGGSTSCGVPRFRDVIRNSVFPARKERTMSDLMKPGNNQDLTKRDDVTKKQGERIDDVGSRLKRELMAAMPVHIPNRSDAKEGNATTVMV